jgi:predicted nucleotidyltransferase
MNTSLAHLPEAKQAKLAAMAAAIREVAPAELILLFGSHARGNWVEDPETGYMSDFDLLVVVESPAVAEEDELWSEVERRIRPLAAPTPVTLIVHGIKFLNKEIRRGQYFFSEIVAEGVLLFTRRCAQARVQAGHEGAPGRHEVAQGARRARGRVRPLWAAALRLAGGDAGIKRSLARLRVLRLGEAAIGGERRGGAAREGALTLLRARRQLVRGRTSASRPGVDGCARVGARLARIHLPCRGGGRRLRRHDDGRRVRGRRNRGRRGVGRGRRGRRGGHGDGRRLVVFAAAHEAGRGGEEGEEVGSAHGCFMGRFARKRNLFTGGKARAVPRKALDAQGLGR